MKKWHGHNFVLHVTIKGIPDADTGFVFDAKKLSLIIKQFVTDVLDHKNLNEDVAFMKGKLCSIENLVVEIWKQLLPQMPEGVQLHALKLFETDKIYVEYFGE